MLFRSAIANVTVVDDIKPIARAKMVTVQLGPDGTGTVAASQVNNGSSDNCSVSVSVSPSSYDCADVGQGIITLTAVDPSGNTASAAVTAIVLDSIPPVAQAKDVVVQLDANGMASIVAADVDNGSSDATAQIAPLAGARLLRCAPGRGGQLGRGAGAAIQLMAKEGTMALLKLPRL